jgi:hypothetical protein
VDLNEPGTSRARGARRVAFSVIFEKSDDLVAPNAASNDFRARLGLFSRHRLSSGNHILAACAGWNFRPAELGPKKISASLKRGLWGSWRAGASAAGALTPSLVHGGRPRASRTGNVFPTNVQENHPKLIINILTIVRRRAR